MDKKGQVMLYVILSVIILLLLAFSFGMIRNTTPEIRGTTPFLSGGFEQQIETCLSLTLKDGINILAQQGGYYDPEHSVTWLGVHSVLYDYGNNLTPSVQGLSGEIAKFIDDNIGACVAEKLSDGRYQFGSPKSIIILTKEKAIADLNYPVMFYNGNNQITKSEFHTEQLTPLIGSLEIVNDIVAQTMEEPDVIDISMSGKYSDAQIEIQRLYGDTFLYFIHKDNLLFIFATQTKLAPPKSGPEIEEILPQRAYYGRHYSYTIKAEGAILFEAITPFFEIDDKTGEIDFTPSLVMKGNYEIPIIAADKDGHTTEQVMRLSII